MTPLTEPLPSDSIVMRMVHPSTLPYVSSCRKWPSHGANRALGFLEQFVGDSPTPQGKSHLGLDV